MAAADEDALRCDMLETYHIFDWRALPARQAALFACGLPDSSRIKRRLSGAPVALETLLLAMIADAVRVLVWQRSQAAADGGSPPASIAEALTRPGKDRGGAGFDTAEEFEAWRASMLGGED